MLYTAVQGGPAAYRTTDIYGIRPAAPISVERYAPGVREPVDRDTVDRLSVVFIYLFSLYLFGPRYALIFGVQIKSVRAAILYCDAILRGTRIH